MPDRLRELLVHLPASPFYHRKLGGRRFTSLAEFPFTTKAELVADQETNPPYGSNLTRPIAEYTRLHQTSGSTSGRSLRWLDTPRSWEWLLGCWRTIYERAGIGAGERVFFAFSFGPFLGFWTAFESAQRSGMLCLSGGGMSTAARLRHLIDHRATVVMCTPTYALHLSEIAANERIDLARSNVNAIVVAGEPGGLIAATRAKLETAWGARVVDHYGLTEVGPVAIEPQSAPGAMEILENDYVAEVIDPGTLAPAENGAVGELVLTNLGRLDSPLVRYRTGDLVRATRNASGLRLEGGVLGRTDDMIHLRGNNLYPAAIEAIVRRFPDVAEFRVEVDDSQSLAELAITVEPIAGADGTELASRIAKAVRDELLFRPTVNAAPPGTLPRFEMKAQRFLRKRVKG